MTENLMNTSEALLPEDPAAVELEVKADIARVVVRHPSSPLAWAILSEEAMVADHRVLAYAFARTGYHRSLDALRKNGWKGSGPVPWSHKPNRGFLRCVAALSRAAGAIGETDEQVRCAQFLRDCSPEAANSLGL
ncbi:MAG TPA: DUF3151 domain-containing protein [Dermatophilaceae bacterium]|nr:DUF3151 domain-containing protein [Dermatophilaceae bacterium]